MSPRSLVLELLPEELAICRLPPLGGIPGWATSRPLFAIVRTRDELTVICPAGVVPSGVEVVRGWRALGLRGPFDFALVGILVSVAQPLAEAGVSVMPVATFETDFVLVRAHQLDLAVATLHAAGHTVRSGAAPFDAGLGQG